MFIFYIKPLQKFLKLIIFFLSLSSIFLHSKTMCTKKSLKVLFYCNEEPDTKQDWYIHDCGKYVIGSYQERQRQPPPMIRRGDCNCQTNGLFTFWMTGSLNEMLQEKYITFNCLPSS